MQQISSTKHTPDPLACSICLPPHINLIERDKTGNECLNCREIFTVFKWHHIRARTTNICTRCSTELNACQCCIKDIKYHIPLQIRDRALEVLHEEGGKEEHYDEVLSKLNELYGTIECPKPNKIKIKELIKKFPTPEDKLNGDCLFVYGIEMDFNLDVLRSYLKSSIERIEHSAVGRYAMIKFTKKPENLPTSVVLDGRRLVFAYGDWIYVPGHLQSQVGALIRHYLKNSLN